MVGQILWIFLIVKVGITEDWEEGKQRTFDLKMMQAKARSKNLIGMHGEECQPWVSWR